MFKKSAISKLPLFVFSLSLPLLTGIIGSYFTYGAIPTWYATLNKPFFSPPNWIFGPVWTLLYILMGISFFLIWSKKSKERINAASIFFTQLIFNTLWSIIFFGTKNPQIALIEIFILWILIYKNIGSFYSINKPAGLLLIPYLAWVTFASILNLAIVILN